MCSYYRGHPLVGHRENVLYQISDPYGATRGLKTLYGTGHPPNTGGHASLLVITLVPTLPAMSISGLVLIEVVFNWPGVGLPVFDSVLTRDTPVIQFIFLVIAIWIVIGNLLIDIAHTVIDPRITYETPNNGLVSPTTPSVDL